MAGHAIVSQAAPTSDGSQNYTKASLGTPKGYLLLGGQVTTLNTDIDDCSISLGASDLAAVNGFCGMANAEHNQSTSDAHRDVDVGSILRIATPGTATVTEVCNHNATVTDGIQVDWVTTTVARQVSAVIFNEGISNMNVQAPTLNGTGTTVITTGFQPDFHIIFSVGRDTTNSSSEGKVGICFIDAAGVTYHGVYNHWGSGDTTPEGAERFDETNLVSYINVAANTFQTYTFGSYTATGFTATKVAGTTGNIFVIASFKMATGYSYDISSVTCPGSPGTNDIVASLSFTPQLAMFASCGATAVGGDAGESSFAFGACTASDEFSIGCAQEDRNTISNTDCSSHHHSDATIYQTDDNGAVVSEAAFSQFKSDAVELNWSNATETIRLAALVIGKDPASAAGGISYHAARRGIGRGFARGIG